MHRIWKKGWVSCLFIVATCVYLLNLTWLKWGSLIIDTGRGLYIPLRLLSGDLLYKDISYQYGPFSPYFNSFLCMIFGIHLRSFIISGILTVIALSSLLYKISRIFLSVLFSIFSVATFLFVFAFGQHYEPGIFNHIIPYTYSATHGTALAISALFFYYRALTKENKIYSRISGFFTALALLTRIEIGIMLILSIFIGIILDFRNRGNLKERCKSIAVYCFFPMIIACFIYGLFAIATKIAAAQGSLGEPYIFLKNLDIRTSFTGGLIGTDDLPKNILLILRTVLYYIGMSIVFFAGGWILLVGRRLPLVKRGIIAVCTALAVATVTVLFQKRFFPYYMQYRCVPLICILLCIIAYRRYSAGMDQRRFLFLMVFSIFSLLLLTRMLFNVQATHYGFYLLVPGMLCYYFFFFKVAPEIFASGKTQNFYRYSFMLLSILFIIGHATLSYYRYEARTMQISSPRGTMRVRHVYYRCRQLLDLLAEKIDPSASLVIFPEGATLNFLSGKDNPLRYYTFLPIDFTRPDFEKDVIDGLKENNVTYVVILNRYTPEYGPARFGIDYAQGIMRYLADDYSIKQKFGPLPFTSKELSLVLLEKNNISSDDKKP